MATELQIEGIGQIAIAVSDLGQAVPFYRDVLGLKLLFEAPPRLAFFDCGGVRLMITTQQGEAQDHHTSAIYYRVEDIQSAVAALKLRGVDLLREPGMTARMEDHELWMAFLRDPDANLIAIMAEVPL